MIKTNKAVLMSIRPKWCELIASGKKTIEVRKTKTKIQTPFKVYIYQTMKPVSVSFSGNGKHISEYDKTLWYNRWSGKVIGEFICNKIEKYIADDDFCYGIYDIDDDTVQKTYLENGSLWEYGKGKPLYGWHISELVIYDEPKELSDFEKPCPYDEKCAKCKYNDDGTYYEPYSSCNNESLFLRRPPQSWCYIRRKCE